MMTNKNISFLNNINKKMSELILIEKIANMYNKILYKYTRDFKGRIAVPKTDTSKIPKKFNKVSDYLESVPAWKQILKLVQVLNFNNIEVYDYLDTMIKNWSEIAMLVNMPDRKIPLSNIILSPKMVNIYHDFKNKEETRKELNKLWITKTNEDFYRLTPSLKVNIKSLFKLKKLNPSLSFYDIINIFRGEFEPEFAEKILSLKEEDITIENLSKIFR